MREDPALDEMRVARHQISEEFAHDIDRLVDYLMEKEKELAEKGRYRFLGVADDRPTDTKTAQPNLEEELA